MSIKKQVLTQLKEIQDLIRDNIDTLNNLIKQSQNLSSVINDNADHKMNQETINKLTEIKKQIDEDIKKSQTFISSLTDKYNILIETLFVF
jgi:hypothetical protein